jgi:REP element-mobilizing transposase RayT
MGRQKRSIAPDALYHVTAQVNRGAFDIRSKADKDLLRSVVAKTKERHPFELVNFSFMDSHFHFLIKPGIDESLSMIMGVLLCTFTKRWNFMHGTKGHLWRARFWSRIVESEDDFLAVVQYIDDNPVQAHLVRDAREWRYGGLWERVHKVSGILCDIDVFFASKYPCAPPLKRFYDPAAEQAGT